MLIIFVRYRQVEKGSSGPRILQLPRLTQASGQDEASLNSTASVVRRGITSVLEEVHDGGVRGRELASVEQHAT